MWLFASEWLPDKPLDRASNLLHVAMWELRRQGLVGLRQLRPVVREPIAVLGGKSFTACDLLAPTAAMDGLEGALLRAARGLEEHDGTRRLVQLLDLHDRTPWDTVMGHCFGEAAAAGLVEVRGRMIKKVVVIDPAGVEAHRERFTEIRAARAADLEREHDLHHAVIVDCLQAVDWAHHTST